MISIWNVSKYTLVNETANKLIFHLFCVMSKKEEFSEKFKVVK